MEKPSMKQRLDSLGKFIYDSDTNKVLGRGGRSWAEIGVFYLIYYACLAGFFAATLAVFYETISDKEPKLLEDSSLLDGNPGLGFRPRIDLDDPKVKAVPEKGKNDGYVDDLEKFLKAYNDDHLDTTDCSKHVSTRKGEKEACPVSFSELTKHCNAANEYGFSEGKPCVLLKLNKVFGWVPKMWDDASAADSGGVKTEWNITYDKNVIPLRCYPKDSDDVLDLGTLQYYPQQGFPLRYYPYENQKDYRAPVVFVKFDGAKPGKTYDIECRAYAKNIEYDRTDMQGSTQFKVYIHKKK